MKSRPPKKVVRVLFYLRWWQSGMMLRTVETLLAILVVRAFNTLVWVDSHGALLGSNSGRERTKTTSVVRKNSSEPRRRRSSKRIRVETASHKWILECGTGLTRLV